MNSKIHFKITLLCFCIVLFNCESKTNTTASNKDNIDIKVDSLLDIMTLEEKVGQLNQYNGFWDVTGPTPENGGAATKYKNLEKGLVGSMLSVRGTENVRAVQKIAVEKTRLGIPLIIGFDVIHGYKTLSPIPLAESASWDLEAIKNSARVAADEASASGINWTFAPMVDISRDARWGRVMEGGGEDPFLASKIAEARVKGFQGNNLSKNNTIAACAKHFAAYGFAEAGKEYNTVDISETHLRNIVLPPFKAAKNAGVKTFMNAFNELNGIPATGNKNLVRNILKKEWDFKGFVVSDWASVIEMVSHGYASSAEEAAKLAIEAGCDLDMESYTYLNNLVKLVKEGKVDEALINDAVRRILKVKFELGLFDDPYKYCDPVREKETVGNIQNHKAVLDVAKKSIVLLKNEKQLLPLQKNGMRIALIGDLADDKTSPLGSWRLASDDGTAVSVLEGLNKYKGNKLTFVNGPKLVDADAHFTEETKINTSSRKGIKKAVLTAKNNDVVVLVLGEHGFQSGEGRSRTSLDLPEIQQELLQEVYKVNKNIVLVLMNGRPLTINWADKNIPAILETWHLGTQSGNAIAQVLYGDYNPSGKLPMTFPKNVGQIPIYYNYKNTGRPTNTTNNVFWSHYSDVENEPLYVFGHGLSYTSFEYKDLKLSTNSFNSKSSITATFTLTNTGKYEGKEIVQMYIRDLFASITRPVKELKDFKMISLKPGESKEVSFTIDTKTTQFFTANKTWETEPGDFKLLIGGSSKTNLEKNFSYIE